MYVVCVKFPTFKTYGKKGEWANIFGWVNINIETILYDLFDRRKPNPEERNAYDLLEPSTSGGIYTVMSCID